MAESVYFDTGVLWSFSVAGGLHHLHVAYEGRAVWVPAVQREVRDYSNSEPHLRAVLDAGWLTLHEFDPDDMGMTAEVEAVRSSFGITGGPRKHLGEAESIVAAREADAWFYTEDWEAMQKARSEGIHRTRMTTEVLHQLVSTGVIDCPESMRLYQAMVSQGRTVPQGLGMQDLCW